MRLVKYRLRNQESLHAGVAVLEGDELVPLALPYQTLADVLETADPVQAVQDLLDNRQRIPLSQATLLAPIDRQEVWAAGVTYKRSQAARMEESEHGASHYDLVYTADRPELFFKASPHRVSGPDVPVRIRQDATWSVPEPELALVLNSRLELVGFTVGNDMSSRDIEGENPLYLPQAKVYDGACALGPCITLAPFMPPREETKIRLSIFRDDSPVFEGETDLGQMHRTFEDLIDYVGRDNSYPDGLFLLTGTGIVPDSDFTLQAGDVVTISIDGIGTLINPVVQG